jgi:hypothetical protein
MALGGGYNLPNQYLISLSRSKFWERNLYIYYQGNTAYSRATLTQLLVTMHRQRMVAFDYPPDRRGCIKAVPYGSL